MASDAYDDTHSRFTWQGSTGEMRFDRDPLMEETRVRVDLRISDIDLIRLPKPHIDALRSAMQNLSTVLGYVDG